MLNRTEQPKIRMPEVWTVQQPERSVLPNGVPLNVLNVGENEVTRIDFLIGGGRWQQTQPLQALFTNRMLIEGSSRYTSTEIAEKLDFYGAWLDLACSSEYSHITLYSLNKYLAETLEVMESVLKEPTFPEKQLEVVVNTNIQHFLVNTSKVELRAHRGLMRSLYGEQHPCGQLVQEEDYHRIHPEELRAFYDRFYHSGNYSIYLSGKVTDECLRRVEALFGSEPFGKGGCKPEKKHFHPVSSPEKRQFIEHPEALQSAVRMGSLTIGRQHPDYLKLRVLFILFGGYFGSRLMSNIREEKGYTYGISAGTLLYPDHSAFVIKTETDNQFVEPLIKEVYAEIDRLQCELVPDEELAMVKNYILGDMCRSYESSLSLADAWISVYASGLSDNYFTEALQAVNDVTSQELRELACRYLCKESLKETVSGKKIS